MNTNRQTNHLNHETSPYLLQHANNPVDWYPWGSLAFEKAKEDKPIFLSIGYSTCHWCHVMAHESFEDKKIADFLNENFISIKVDKEERPDIDSIYMSVCQAFTGSGGWPMSIFMTPDQKPFYAGTYFPKESQYGLIGFYDLLSAISEKWKTDKDVLIKSGDEITQSLNHEMKQEANISEDLIKNAVSSFQKSFDKKYGGFGKAPKFPSPHNLMFLMNYYEATDDKDALYMVEKTLLQMYKGGLFDHFGFGFSRYSTDQYFLAPHFEKMLYDNALLMISYIKAYAITKNELFKKVAMRTAEYVMRELTDSQGGFYCAQDADSEGVEGKYYVFDYDELLDLFGEELGGKINAYYGITKEGNFEGRSIPNLLNNNQITGEYDSYLPQIYEYRKGRTTLHLDDKILTSWNSLMIVAFVTMYRVIGDAKYLDVAMKACDFIQKNLLVDDTIYVSYREGKISSKGFLDDYAFYIYALIHLYEATFDNLYLDKAVMLTNKVIQDFYDTEHDGFYLYGNDNEQLILKPKETYDGAIPSGNSIMAYNLIKLAHMMKDVTLEEMAQKQLAFMSSYAKDYPTGYSFYLMALSFYLYPQKEIVCVLKANADKEILKRKFPLNTTVRVLEKPTDEYQIINDQTTFYVCQNFSCKPPTNDIETVML